MEHTVERLRLHSGLRQEAPARCSNVSNAEESPSLVVPPPPPPPPPALDEHFDAIVVGAGVVGSAFANYLGQQGRRVLVLERDLSPPARIVGELLQPGGIKALEQMGLTDCLEGIDAQMCYGYAVFRDGQALTLPYPRGHTGRSFHHGRFVDNLRRSLVRVSTVHTRQGTASKLLEDDAGKVVGVTYLEGRQTKHAYAPLTVICDGCFSKFRKGMIQAQPTAKSSFVGLILKGTQMPVPNHGHVVLTSGSPVLAYAIGSDEVRTLVDVVNPLPSQAKGELARYLHEVVAPQMPPAMRAPFTAAIDEGRLRTMPNSILHSERAHRDGLVLLGDAANMRHPLTGGGMTVGLRDAHALVDALRPLSNLGDYAAVREVYARFFDTRRVYAGTINVLSVALYEVFTGGVDPLLPDACFNYFRLGGPCVAGPMALLAGVAPSSNLLIGHFFAVALLGVSRQLLPLPLPWRVARAYRLLRAAVDIIAPLLRAEGIAFNDQLSARLVNRILSTPLPPPPPSTAS